MIDEIKLAREAERATQAQRLLTDPLLTEAYATIEADLVKMWIGSEARDDDGRKRLWDAVQANRKHQDFLAAVLSNGKLANAELTNLARGKKRGAI